METSKHDLINALGKKESSKEVETLINSVQVGFSREKGVMPGEIYRICEQKGVSLTFESENEEERIVLSAIHLVFDGRHGFGKFYGWIGDNLLTNKISLEDIKDFYGKPTKFGGGEKGFMNKVDPFWLRYDYSNFVIHYQFSNDNKYITQVTLMTPESAP